MSHTPLANLAALTDTLFQAEQMTMRHIVQQEARLRRDIAQLDAHRAASLALPEDQLRPARQIGADVQWQAWLGRARTDLNRQLALCLVQKARMMTALRHAHGRNMAANQIVKEDRLARARRRAQQDLITEDSLAMLKKIQTVRPRG